jgi:3-keto-disaccharide hydrolase
MKVCFLPKRFAIQLAIASVGLAMLTPNSFAADEGKELPPPKDEPKVVDAGPPPSDAIVLFDGKDLSQWESDKNGPAKWKVEDGVATVNGTGGIHTKQSFGDCQLHVEWATPAEVKGEGQGRGNSGIFLQSRYELQVLDSYNNKTYFHGQAGSIYKQHAPLVNCSRKPGEWQTYDVIYHAPRFDADGKLTKPGTMTVLQNGVLVQDNAEILGSTSHAGAPKYTAHALKQPLTLQDHHNPVRYRNIWIREL